LLFRDGAPTLRTDPVFESFGWLRAPAAPSGKSRAPDSDSPINFAFRLRQLLGVGVRAEVVRHLLTSSLEAATVSDIEATAGYARRNIYEAVTDLHGAGVAVLMPEDGEQRFALNRPRWARLLDIPPQELPMHRDWAAHLGAAREVLRWLRGVERDELSEYMRASRAAELLDSVRPRLVRAGVVMAPQRGVSSSLEDLADTVEHMLLWLAPSESSAGAAASFDIVADASGGYRWRLKASGGRVVATAAESYVSLTTARAAVERLRLAGREVDARITSDAGVYRWQLVADNGRVLAVSTEAFATKLDAQQAAQVAREMAAEASREVSEASELIDPRRHHVTRRADGAWQVQREGATRAQSVHRTQSAAVGAARAHVRRAVGSGEVVVHRADGSVRSREAILRS